MNNLKKKALSLLAMREHSRKELFNKIRPHALNDNEVNMMLDELEVNGYLSDERFVDSYIVSKKKKFGSLKIRYLLQNKGAKSDLINDYIAKIDKDDEIELAYNLLYRKIGENRDEKSIARGIRFLQGRGFSMDVIKLALRKLIVAYQ